MNMIEKVAIGICRGRNIDSELIVCKFIPEYVGDTFTNYAFVVPSIEARQKAFELFIDDAKVAIEAMKEHFKDHYWDSLQKDKDTIMLHIEAMSKNDKS